MDATELARWKRFASKGGIGKCTAIADCVAEVTTDLMFFEDDEITVLMLLEGEEGRYMGYCEGVVGHFSASDVRFHGKLKKAMTTPRSNRPSSPHLEEQPTDLPTPASSSPVQPPRSVYPLQVIATAPSPPSLPLVSIVGWSSDSTSLMSAFEPGPALPPVAARSSFASAPDSSMPQTPGDLPVQEPVDEIHDDEESPLSKPIRASETRGQDRDETNAASAPMFQPSALRSPFSAQGSPAAISPGYHPTPPSDLVLSTFSSQTPDESGAYDDEPTSRASVAFSDGEFGIGMQFIQGLIDQTGGDDADGMSGRRRSGASEMSVDTDGSIVRPPWRTSSPLPAASYDAALEPDYRESQVLRGAEELPGSRSSSHRSRSRSRSPQASLFASASHRSSRPSSPKPRSQSPHPPSASSSTDSRQSGKWSPPRSPSRQALPHDRTMSLSELVNDEVTPMPAQSPAMSSFPSESEVGGYYEEDVDIYDDYRYSRYSTISRKSRKSQLPDPRSMPPADAFPFPPPVVSTSTSILTPPVSGHCPLDQYSSVHASSRSPPSSLASSKSSKFSFQLDSQSPTLRSVPPLRIPQRGGPMDSLPDNVLAPSALPLSPAVGSARSGMFASTLRQQMEEEERQKQSSSGGVVPNSLDIREGDPTPNNSLPDSMGDGSNVWTEEPLGLIVLPSQDSAPDNQPASPSSLRSRSMSSRSRNGSLALIDTDMSAPLRLRSSNQQTLLDPRSTPAARRPRPRRPSEVVGSPIDEYTPTLSDVSESHAADPISPQKSALAQLEGRPSQPFPSSPSVVTFSQQLSLDSATGPFVSPSGRPLTFLPHPNAPKPLSDHTEPTQPAIYAAQQQRAPLVLRQQDSLYNMMMSAAAHYYNPRGPSPVATIHGRTTIDLSQAPGPVLIEFFLDREGKGRPPPTPQTPRFANAGFSPITEPTTPGASSSHGSVMGSPREKEVPSPGGPIPRANFFPKAGAPRPRSRSFNGFTTSFVEVGLPIDESKETGVQKGFRVPSLRSMRSSRAASSTSPPAQTPRATSLSSRSRKTPPPLSIPRSSGISSALRSPPPSSLLSRPPVSSATFSSMFSPPADEARDANEPQSTVASSAPLSPSMSPGVGLRSVASASGLRSESPKGSVSELRDRATSPASGKMSLTDDDSTRAPSVARSHSLRSKMSIAALKGKAGRGDPAGSHPETPTAQFEFSEETVQVKEGSAATEFELVRPVLPRISLVKDQEDAESEAEATSARSEKDGESGRSSSPVVSTRQRTMRTPVDAMATKPDLSTSPSGSTSIETHRAREQKWLNAMNTTPPASARKNKKVKKLVQEGIPNSVRSVVWLYLTNSKARRMEGLYAQLCARGKVGPTEDIQRDADRSFPSHPHLRDPLGPIVSLLQAYLMMVPDIRYQQGLAAMAGTILLQSPEEDAFWTFLALMDNHVRGYYAVNSLQMAVDSRLFQKALETADSSLAKKLFVDLKMNPIDVCRPWFSALFSNTLPNRYLYRVWDMFICEGAPWLFRVGLTVLLASKPYLMETRGLTTVDALDYLFRPPVAALGVDPDAFIAAALAVKVKEDDLRKARPKIEAVLKQQQLSPRPAAVQTKDVRTITPRTSALQ